MNRYSYTSAAVLGEHSEIKFTFTVTTLRDQDQSELV